MYKISPDGIVSFSLRKIGHEDVETVRRLADRCVGENLYSAEEISSAIGSSNRFFHLLQDEHGSAVGYIYCYLTTEEALAEYSKLDGSIFQALPYRHGRRVGKIQSVSVDHEYRGMGLATAMMEFVLEEMGKLSVDAVFIVCWKPQGTIPLQKALQECGFSFLSVARHVWYDDTRLICPYCRGRCTCDAEVYYKMLKGDEA